jgi:DNA-binding IclR family transcriptional regulator
MTSDDASGVAAVDRAIAVVDSVVAAPGPVSLNEIATATGFYKSTILRLSESLIRAKLLHRGDDGCFSVGVKALSWGARFQKRIVSVRAIFPMMQEIAAHTGESVAFYAPTSDGRRVCLLRVDSTKVLRFHVNEGDVLPLDRGSGGRVLAAFSGALGEPYDTIRRERVYISRGERDPEIAGIALPIFREDGSLFGALTVAGPVTRLDNDFFAAHVEYLRAAAHKIEAIAN